MRDRLSRYFDYATLSLERWPLKAIDFDIATDGLTSTYRRARQLVPDSWSEAEAEDLHDLRRRVVEHRHQMDLVEPLWPRLGKVWAEEAQRLRNRLGACQDLAVLNELTAPHQPLAPWRSRLAPLIVARRGAHLKTAATACRPLVCRKTESVPPPHRGAVVGAQYQGNTDQEHAGKMRASPFQIKWPPLLAAVLKIVHRDEENPSLAGLAATYSSKP